MDWEILLKYLPMYEKAAWLTIQIGFMGVAGATVLGLICAVIQYERIPFLRQITAMYIELSRNTPLLVQLFFIYYGLPKIGIQTDPKICGIVGLAFLGGGYMAETFRSGLESVADIQCDKSGDEPGAGDVVCDHSAGCFCQCSCICGKHYFFVERNQCIQCDQFDGFDVYGKRFDRTLL